MRELIVVTVGLALLGAASCGDDDGPSSPSTSADVWAEMRGRAVELPEIERAGECPVTKSSQVSEAYAPASGDGPVYPVMGEGRLGLGNGRIEGGWEYVKVLWVSDDTYSGAVLIRGGQIDGDSELRFQRGSDPPSMLELPEERWATSPDGEPGWREWPSYTRIAQPGCYAYQIDGTDFTDYVVFQATRVEA